MSNRPLAPLVVSILEYKGLAVGRPDDEVHLFRHRHMPGPEQPLDRPRTPAEQEEYEARMD